MNYSDEKPPGSSRLSFEGRSLFDAWTLIGVLLAGSAFLVLIYVGAPPKLLLAALLVFPPLTLLAVITTHGKVISVVSAAGSPISSAMFCVVAADTVAYFVHFEDIGRAWLFVLVLGTVMTLIVFAVWKWIDRTGDSNMQVLAVVVSLMFGFGQAWPSFVIVNNLWDASPPAVRPLKVVNYYYENIGRHRHYYVNLIDLKSKEQIMDYRVRLSMAEQISHNKKIAFFYHKGVLGAVWRELGPLEPDNQ